MKMTRANLELLTDIDILLMVEKSIRGRISHAIPQCTKANNKYIKFYAKNKEPSDLKYWDINNLYGWAMSQKLSKNNFCGLKIFLNLMKDLQKIIMKEVMKDIF